MCLKAKIIHKNDFSSVQVFVLNILADTYAAIWIFADAKVLKEPDF